MIYGIHQEMQWWIQEGILGVTTPNFWAPPFRLENLDLLLSETIVVEPWFQGVCVGGGGGGYNSFKLVNNTSIDNGTIQQPVHMLVLLYFTTIFSLTYPCQVIYAHLYCMHDVH